LNYTTPTPSSDDKKRRREKNGSSGVQSKKNKKQKIVHLPRRTGEPAKRAMRYQVFDRELVIGHEYLLIGNIKGFYLVEGLISERIY